jgi:hypothetical protein
MIFSKTREESDISLQLLSDVDASFDIELTDTKWLLEDPPIPLFDKTAAVETTTAPRPHPEIVKVFALYVITGD